MPADSGATISPWWRVYLAATLAITGAFLVLPDSGAARAWLYVTIFALTLTMVLVGIRVNRPAGAVVWWALAAGEAVVVGAGVAWYLYPSLSGVEPPFPSLGDFLHLCAYLLFIVALGLLVRRRGEGGDRVELLDVAIIAVGAGVLSLVFLIAPNLHGW